MWCGGGLLSKLKKPPWREDDHSSPPRADIKYVWSYTSVPRECFHGGYRDKFTSLLLCYLCNFTSQSGEYGRYGEEVHAGLWKENLKERYHIENIGIIVRIILKWVLSRVGRRSMY